MIFIYIYTRMYMNYSGSRLNLCVCKISNVMTKSLLINGVPSGKCLHKYGKSFFSWEHSTVSMGHSFNSKVLIITRGYIHKYPSIIPVNHPYEITLKHITPLHQVYFYGPWHSYYHCHCKLQLKRHMKKTH